MSTERTHLMRSTEMVMLLLLLAGAWLPKAMAADGDMPPQVTSQVFKLNKTTAAGAADRLRKLNLGETVSEIHSANAIIVTCAPAELPKVRTIVKYFDTVPDMGVKMLTPLPLPSGWPTNAAIQEKLSGITVGTFKEPPTIGPGGVVIDEHGGYMIAVGASSDLQKVIEAIQSLQGQAAASTTTSTSTSGGAEAMAPSPDDKLFDKLMEALNREEKAAQSKAAPAEPATSESAPAPEAAESGASAQMSDEKIAEMVRMLVKQETEKLNTASKQTAAAAEPVANVPEAALPSDFNVPAADLELELQLPDRLEVIDLLDLLGKYLHLNYMFDENVLRGQAVNLRVQGKIKVRDLYAIAENVLRFRGLVMTRSKDLVTITQMAASSPSQGAFITGVEGVRPGDVMVTKIFQLRYATTSAVRTLLASLKFANNGQNISEIPDTGTLVVTDYSVAMPKIEELLTVVDRPGEDRTFRFVKLKYTMAKNLAPKLKDLAEQLGSISISVSASVSTPAVTTPGLPRTPMPSRMPTVTQPQTKSGVYLDYDERTNRLLIVGRSDEIAVVEDLIADLDVAQQDLRTLKQYTIQHVDTSEVLGTLKELGIVQDTPETTTRTTTTTTARTRPGMPATPVPQPETTTAAIVGTGPVVEPPMISVIAATNSLLIYATAEQHAAISLVIAYVDAERGESNINYVVYPLENQDPEKLKGVLESLITGRSAIADAEKKVERSTAVRPGQPVTQPATASVPPSEAAEQEITIVADPSTYSLLVYASKKNHQWISGIIKELDQYRPQVLLDCTLVEISRDDAFQYDVDLLTKEGSFIRPGGVERITNPSAATNAPFGDFTDKSILEASSVAGTGTAFFGDKHIQMLLTAMQQKKYGRVMSRPQILVNDNEEGTIKAENKVYIPNQKTNYITGTTSTGGTTATPVQDVTFEAYPAGITLTITPHISKGDNLRLQVLLDRTNQGDPTTVTLSDGSKVTAPPNQTSNNVTSVVTVPDNSTIILGGLESLNQSKGGTKVPILGDLPLIGGAFRSVDNTDRQTKLYVFIKAHILRPGEDAGTSATRKVSRAKIEGFEKMERDFQKYQDWPGLDAQPMKPDKVLDEQ